MKIRLFGCLAAVPFVVTFLVPRALVAQSAYSTLQSVTCTGGVTGFLVSAGTIQVFDGPTQVGSMSVAANASFVWPIPSSMNDTNVHVVSVNVVGGAELQNSPQSFTCHGGSPTPYSPQVSYASFSSVPSGAAWSLNGSVGATNGLLFSPSNGSLIYNSAIVPENSSESNQYEYEINTGITLNPQTNGGSYIHYIYGSSTALQETSGSSPTGIGTYHAVELYNPTFDDVGNCTATLNSWEKTSPSGAPTLQGSTTVPCGPTVRMRTVVFKQVGSGVLKVWTLLDNILYSFGTSVAAGQPGIGLIGTPSTNAGFSSLAIGPKSIIGPAPISPPLPANQNPTTVNTSIFPNQVDIHWQEPQDSTGVGVVQHVLTRAANTTGSGYSTGWATLSTDFADDSVQPQQSYVYAESERSFHGIFGPQTNIYVVTPASGAVDPRRIGVQSNGSYWGALGENIDTLSGNLNLTLPLLKAQGRNGWSVPLGLSYNSQNWRQDNETVPVTASFNWNLGEDIGYGYGWKLQLGSIVPFWTGTYYGAVDHYVFTDSTGAQYDLKPSASGLWTDQNSLYVGFDPVAGVLHFRDGTSWIMGCTSGGLEPDFGTMYPTELDDTNGNQIAIRYATGWGVNWANSSGRIAEIQDVRATPNSPSLPRTYYFTYAAEQGDVIPTHLSAINNTIGTGETYTFMYNNQSSPATWATLVDPFARGPYGNIFALTGVNLTASSLNYYFVYDVQQVAGAYQSSGQMVQANFPLGGILTWTHLSTTYNNSRKQMEVTRRTMQPGATAYAYNFARTFANGSDTTHNSTTLSDANGDQRAWTYLTSGNSGSNPVGLLASAQITSASGSIPSLVTPTWSLDAGSNPYVSSISSCVYATCATSTQTLDGYGNTRSRRIFNYGNNSSTADRTYNYTYPPDYVSQYVTNHIFSPVVSVSIAAGAGSPVTVLSNAYDSAPASALPAGVTCPGISCPTEWNSAYTSTSGALRYRGNLTQTTAKGVTTTYTVNVLGNRITTSNSVKTVNASLSSATNYALPDWVNLNGTSGLQTNLAYNAFLGTTSVTDNGNGAVSAYTYDGAGRTQTATSPDGSIVTYTYATSAPFTQTATVTKSDHAQNRSTVTVFDGFGRTVNVKKYDSAGVLSSRVDTNYTPSSCAPLGMATSSSLPYVSGTAVNTTSTFDGAGHPLTVTQGDGSVTSYSYSGNTVTVTDPASSSTVPIWKTIASDVWGNITSVVEPDPSSPTTKTFTTGYAYNIQNNLTSVTMTRGTNTQTRTFSYDPTTFLLTSKTEPETGTTSYTYNADGTIHTKSLANGKGITYNYDSYGRNTGWTGSSGNGTIVKYDQNDIANLSSFTTNAWGRVAYKLVSCPGFYPTYTCAEMYSYTQSGHVTGKKIVVYNASNQNTPTLQIEGDFTYDNEGRLSSITYPNPVTASPMTYTYNFDTMGRPAGMAQGATVIASGAGFNPANQMTALTYSVGTEVRGYNSLNQLTSIETGDAINVRYLYASGKDNGQITQGVDQIGGESILYSYDSLKRLTAATASAVPHAANHSFEQSTLSVWTTTAATSAYQVSDQAPHSGTYALHLLNTATLSQPLSSCVVGTAYTITGYHKEDPSVVGTVTIVAGSQSKSQIVQSASVWTQFSFTFTHTGCSSPSIQISLPTNQLAAGTVWFDDISVTAGGANLVGNPGFETTTMASWTPLNSPRITYSVSHDGAASLLEPQRGQVSQTVSGAIPNTSYVVSAWCFTNSASTTGTLTVGSGGTPGTTQSTTWTLVQGSGSSNSYGQLAITLAASNNSGAVVYWDDVTITPITPTSPRAGVRPSDTMDSGICCRKPRPPEALRILVSRRTPPRIVSSRLACNTTPPGT